MCCERRANIDTRIHVGRVDSAEHTHRGHAVAAYGRAIDAGEPSAIRITGDGGDAAGEWVHLGGAVGHPKLDRSGDHRMVQ